MFETSRPQDPKRRRLFFFELLPVSLAFHGCLLAAVLLANLWNVTFPSQSPKMFMAFRFADAPPPPPPPPPPRPAARPQSVIKPVKPPEEIVAPTVVPDEIPIVESEVLPPPEEEAVEGGVEGGISGGELGGVVGGVEGGVMVEKPPPPPPPSDGRVHVARDEPLELFVLEQPYPIYPFKAVSKGWEDSLVVRYVIGRNGRVKDVTIIDPPEREEFVQPTLTAIRTWRFRPLVRDGKRVEVVHELTVNFELRHQGR